jgi:hypothetical protein
LNTDEDDWALTVTADAEWAYFSSKRKGCFGDNDI